MTETPQTAPIPEIPQGSFTVLVPDPRRVYVETLAMEASSARAKNLRKVTLPSGFFTTFTGEIIFPRREIELLGEFQYNPYYLAQSYWPQQDVTALQAVLGRSPKERMVSIREVTTYGIIKTPCWELSLAHPEGSILTTVALWYASESNNWKEQVELIQKHRQAYPEFAKLRWDEHEEVIHGNPLKNPLPNAGPVFHTTSLLLTDRPLITNDSAFKRYLEVFRGDIEDVIQAITEVKQITQPGMLNIR